MVLNCSVDEDFYTFVRVMVDPIFLFRRFHCLMRIMVVLMCLVRKYFIDLVRMIVVLICLIGKSFNVSVTKMVVFEVDSNELVKRMVDFMVSVYFGLRIFI